MKRRAALIMLGTILILLLAATAGHSQETHTAARLEISNSEQQVLRGANRTIHISVFSSIDQHVILQLSTAYEEYFELNGTSFFIKEGEYVYIPLQMSVPSDARKTTFYPVLKLHSYYPGENIMSVEPIATLSFKVSIVTDGDDGSAADHILPLLLIFFGILEIGGIIFLIWTRRRRYRDFKIRDVFLIYKDGRLIKHIATHSEASLDHFTVSSMLTAISNYINDSFRSQEEAGRYGELQHGDLRVLVEHGDNVDLAVVVSGEYPPKLKRIMGSTLENIESTYSLGSWDGDYSIFVNLNKVLRPLILMQREKKGRGEAGVKGAGPEPVDDRVDRFGGTSGGEEDEEKTAVSKERAKRLEEMAKRLIAVGAFPKEAKKELIAHLSSLDESQVSSFDALMDHISLDPSGKKVHFIEVPAGEALDGDEKNLDR